MFGDGAEHAAGVFVVQGVAKAVSVLFDAEEEVFDDFVNVHEFLGALEVFVETGVFAVVVDGFLNGLGVEARPFADEGVDHLLAVFHDVVSLCF